jgi:hypothetical protein
MPKKNITFRYFDEKKPDNISYIVPPSDTVENLHAIPRLAYSRFSFDTSYCQLANQLKNRPEQLCPTIFLDTCFITGREINNELWDEILKCHPTIIDAVAIELKPWLHDPRKNKYFHSFVNDYSNETKTPIDSVSLQGLTSNQNIISAAHYYITLLALRKTVYADTAKYIRSISDRELSDNEIEKLVQKRVQDRGLTLAKKGQKDFGKINFATDECLLVVAFFHAVLTGKETIILTRDSDLLEQFYKLTYMIDTHYRCMYIANHLKDQPLNFEMKAIEALESDNEKPEDYSIFNSRIDISKAHFVKYPMGFSMSTCLPLVSNSVCIHVIHFGERKANADNQSVHVDHLIFCAEKEMLSLFEIKGKTNGRNTDKFEDRNFHIRIDPNLENEIPYMLLAKDRNRFECEDFFISAIDYDYVLSRHEGLSEKRVNAIEINSNDTVGANLNTIESDHPLLSRCDTRLGIVPPGTDFQHFSLQSLKQVIAFFPVDTIFFADQSFMHSPLLKNWSDVLRNKSVWSNSHFDPDKKFNDILSTDYQLKFNRCTARISQLFSPELAAMWEYYYFLLGHKRFVGRNIQTKIHVHSRDDETRYSFTNELKQLVFGTRRFERALSGTDSINNDFTLLQPEALLATSFIISICRGANIVFLTTERTIYEQFITLFVKIISDYYDWCFANNLNVIGGFETTHVVDNLPQLKQCGLDEPYKITMIPKLEFTANILPKFPYVLNCHCWLFNHGSNMNDVRLYPLSCNLERPMIHMLMDKGRYFSENACKDTIHPHVMIHSDLDVMMVVHANDSYSKIGTSNIPTCIKPHKIHQISKYDLHFIQNQTDVLELPWHIEYK